MNRLAIRAAKLQLLIDCSNLLRGFVQEHVQDDVHNRMLHVLHLQDQYAGLRRSRDCNQHHHSHMH